MFEREGDIQQVIDDIGPALGVEEIHADVHHRDTAPGCAAALGLDEQDAWYERNTFQIPPRGNALSEIYPASVAYLTDAGFVVDELVAPLSGSQGVRALRDDLTVVINFGVGADAGANLRVTAGPCAIRLTPVPDRFGVVDP